MDELALFDQARARVDQTPALRPYARVLLYDWRDPRHWEWVCTADEDVLIDWARLVLSFAADIGMEWE